MSIFNNDPIVLLFFQQQNMPHQNNNFPVRPTSLPPYISPPPATTPPHNIQNISVVDGSGSGSGGSRRASESGSESEHSISGGGRKDRDYKKTSVLSNLFSRRKKPSQS